MKIVIELSEEDYKDITLTGENTINLGVLLALRKAVRNGAPLLKGHGRLIDVDELLKEKRCFEDFDGDTFNIIHEETVINAPTIIEADTTESEDKE